MDSGTPFIAGTPKDIDALQKVIGAKQQSSGHEVHAQYLTLTKSYWFCSILSIVRR